MKGLSSKEMEIISHLEFEKRYFFNRQDIKKFFKTYNQMRHTIHKLLQKNRIIRLNRKKYYLIPVKARTGKWAEESFILIDEIMDGKDYFIGGWAAANYWRLTDQIPMKIETYTTKRQGIKKFLATTVIFRRTTKKRLSDAVTEKVGEHAFKILSKEKSKKWL